jgi:hypothetical protein
MMQFSSLGNRSTIPDRWLQRRRTDSWRIALHQSASLSSSFVSERSDRVSKARRNHAPHAFSYPRNCESLTPSDFLKGGASDVSTQDRGRI